MRSYVKILIKYDWCLYEKRKLGHRHTQRKDHVKTQGGDSHLLAEERDLRRNQAARHFDCGLLVSGTVRNKFLIFKPAILQYLQQP